MKAAQISEYGDPSVVRINEVKKPSPGEGQILIEVYAASLNPWDTKVREGATKSFMPLDFPATMGGDFAGVVAELGSGVESLQVGDKVYGSAGLTGGSGAFAEFAIAPAKHVAKAPLNLDLTESASLVLVGVSAWQALTEYLDVRSGEKILIQGGSGGIGSIAVQIAKHLGAYVAATAPAEGVDLVKALGADEVIDYKTQDFTQLVRDYDVVFDTVGGETFTKSIGVLKPDGRAGSMIADIDETPHPDGVQLIRTNSEATTERLDRLRELVEQGVVTPRVAKVFPLEQAAEAFQARESGGLTGKVVIKVKK